MPKERKISAIEAAGKKNFEKLQPTEKKEIREELMADLPFLAQSMIETREGRVRMGNSQRTFAPKDITLSKAAQKLYGIQDEAGKPSLSKTLELFGVRPGEMSFSDMAGYLGGDERTVLSGDSIANFMRGKDSFAAPANTREVAVDARFIIQEVILEAVMAGYEYSSIVNQLVGSRTQVRTSTNIVVPYFERGDSVPSKIAEGATIPLGSTRFAKKTVNTFKVGTGFEITDELIRESSIDHVYIFFQEAGNEMAISRDYYAIQVLLNGEQADLSQSSPAIGTISSGAITYADIDRVVDRMTNLKLRPNLALMREGTVSVDLNAAALSRPRQTVEQYLREKNVGVAMGMVPAGSILFLNANRALGELQYGAMRTEPDRDPSKQVNYVYMTAHVGYYRINRGAAVLLDSGTTFASAGWPTYMDYEGRIQAGFREI